MNSCDVIDRRACGMDRSACNNESNDQNRRCQSNDIFCATTRAEFIPNIESSTFEKNLPERKFLDRINDVKPLGYGLHWCFAPGGTTQHDPMDSEKQRFPGNVNMYYENIIHTRSSPGLRVCPRGSPGRDRGRLQWAEAVFRTSIEADRARLRVQRARHSVTRPSDTPAGRSAWR